MRLFALHDSSPALKKKYGSFQVTPTRAAELNAQGYGIFWAVNLVKGERLAKNVTTVRAWFVEIDVADKEAQKNLLKTCPLIPSLVVETRKGYHVYWRAVAGTGVEDWYRIVRWGLVPYFGGDPKSSDPSRILRAPGYYHLKDPTNPFYIKKVWDYQNLVYRPEQMKRAFPDKEPKREPAPAAKQGGSFWQRVAQLDGREAIEKLSGHWLCKGETFRLEEQANGNANIIRDADDYSTGCWVWEDGRMGGIEGGNSIASWCHWYGHTWSEVARGLKELFPELHEDSKQAGAENPQRESDTEA